MSLTQKQQAGRAYTVRCAYDFRQGRAEELAQAYISGKGFTDIARQYDIARRYDVKNKNTVRGIVRIALMGNDNPKLGPVFDATLKSGEWRNEGRDTFGRRGSERSVKSRTTAQRREKGLYLGIASARS